MSSNADFKKCLLRSDSRISYEKIQVRKRLANVAEFY